MRVVVQREGGYGEWTLIELQGEVATHSEASLEGLELGTFTILDKKVRPFCNDLLHSVLNYITYREKTLLSW